SEFVCNQRTHHQPRPQAKIETVLARVLAVDPTEKLLLLLGGERARAPRPLARSQCTQPAPFPLRFFQPFIDDLTTEAVRRDHRAGLLALPNTLNRHPANLFQSFVV